MITNEKYLLYILGVNKGQLDYLLAHIEDCLLYTSDAADE